MMLRRPKRELHHTAATVLRLTGRMLHANMCLRRFDVQLAGALQIQLIPVCYQDETNNGILAECPDHDESTKHWWRRHGEIVARTTDTEELRAAQAVLLPAVAAATLEQTAAILGVPVEPPWFDCSNASANRFGPPLRGVRAGAADAKPCSASSKRHSSWPRGPNRPSRRACWCSRRSARPWHSAWVGRWPPRWCGGCWPDTGGAKWLPIHATPRAIWWRSRRGKKTPPNAGCRREASRTGRAFGASDVPGRSPIWPDGASPALLGPAAVPTGNAQWLRTTIHVCLRRGQSVAGRARLDDL